MLDENQTTKEQGNSKGSAGGDCGVGWWELSEILPGVRSAGWWELWRWLARVIVNFVGGLKGWLSGGVEDIVGHWAFSGVVGVVGLVGRRGCGVGWWELRRWIAGLWYWLAKGYREFCWRF